MNRIRIVVSSLFAMARRVAGRKPLDGRGAVEVAIDPGADRTISHAVEKGADGAFEGGFGAMRLDAEMIRAAQHAAMGFSPSFADEIGVQVAARADETERGQNDPPATPASERPPGVGVGTRIGPYRLLERLGEGGFGVVYLAEQERPVRRRVAVKLIRHGMDTQRVLARFEAERQALALMEHPAIATVLDVGVSGSACWGPTILTP